MSPVSSLHRYSPIHFGPNEKTTKADKKNTQGQHVRFIAQTLTFYRPAAAKKKHQRMV